jgi:predicted dehydrogenase
MKEIRLGLVGFGTIGKFHTMAYRNLPLSVKDPQVKPRLVALLRSQLGGGSAPAAAACFDMVTTDPEEFYAQGLDAVDICTPNHLHLTQVSRALEAGVAVYCEKPLAVNWQEALMLSNLAEARRVITQVAYGMRYAPGIRQIKSLLQEGLLGEVFHFRAYKYHASYLDEKRPITWRLRFDQSGGGAFQDLGSHLADLAGYLLGQPARLRAEMRTFIRQRPQGQSGTMGVVDVDDWARCSLEYAGGAAGTLEVSRMAAGAGEATGLEIYGSKGSLIYRNDRPETADYYDLSKKHWQTSDLMPVEKSGDRPISQLWPEKKFSQGDMLNRHLAEIYDFLLNAAEKTPSSIDFRAAARAQGLVEAAYRSSVQDGAWLNLPLAGG